MGLGTNINWLTVVYQIKLDWMLTVEYANIWTFALITTGNW